MRTAAAIGVIAGSLAGGLLLAQEPAPRKPDALKPGDTIALVAPAGNISEERLQQTIAGLEALGYNVKAADNVTSQYKYLAGTDEERARGVMDAWLDPQVDAIFCVTGGYGVTRMLDRLDYEAIAARPKILTGFSDITALHLAVYQRANMVAFHSPTTMAATINDRDSRPFQAIHLWRAIASEEYHDENGRRLDPGWTIPMVEPTSPTVTLIPGKARGRLTGGNLSLIDAIMGGPYEIDVKNKILFLEDVGEKPYRIDRMLSTLELAGKLDEPAGVVLGLFARCDPSDPETSFTVDEVFERYFADKAYPVVKMFPVGHVIENATVPLGIMAELDADAGIIRLLEDPVAIPGGE